MGGGEALAPWLSGSRLEPVPDLIGIRTTGEELFRESRIVELIGGPSPGTTMTLWGNAQG